MTDSEYEIENTGVSIEKGRRKELWKPFERADESRSAERGTVVQGTGIGLTIVRDILDVHGFDYRLAGDKSRVTVKIQLNSL